MDLEEAVIYRMAFGLAADLAEADEHRMSGRLTRNAAAGGAAEQILAEVIRRLAVNDEPGRELVREAVEDALAKRRPKW